MEILIPAHDPRAAQAGRPLVPRNCAVNRVALAVNTPRADLAGNLARRFQQFFAQPASVLDPDAEGGVKDTRLVFSFRVMRVQAVITEFSNVGKGAAASGKWLTTSVRPKGSGASIPTSSAVHRNS